MPDTMGRLWSTADSMKQYPGLDEPLLINQSEVDNVAVYCAKLSTWKSEGSVRQEELRGILLSGNAMVFGRRIKVI